MARRVFFSFDYDDVWQAMQIRNSWVTQSKEAAGFIDAADKESLKQKGDAAIRAWIDGQLGGTSVTAVLVGAATCSSRWVKYEIAKSQELGHGLLGIDISKLGDKDGNTSDRCGKIPDGYPFYLWNTNGGYANFGTWIEDAAKAAGK
jgi:hypothetical protein